jgi:HAMP domain-containing protein
MFKNLKISTIIIIAFLFVAILAGTIGTLYFYSVSSKIIKEDAFNHLEATAQSRTEHIETYLKQNIERLKLITSRTGLKESIRSYQENPSEEIKKKITERIESSQVAIGEFERICILGLDGKIITSSDENFCGKDVSDKDFFINAKRENGVYFIEEDNQKKIFVSGPFILDGKLVGIGITVVNMNLFGEIVKNRTGLKETGEVLVTTQGNDKRIYLFERLFEEEALNQDIESEATAEPMKQALLGNEALFENTLDYRDKEVIAISQYIELGQIGLVAKMDRVEILETTLSILVKTSLAIIIFIITIAGLIGFFVSKSITKPISILQQGIKIIEKGNLNYKVMIDSNNEIGQLAKNFNQMSDKLQKSKIGIEEKIEERTGQLEKLNRSMIGRELKMIELKKKNQELKNKLKIN